MTNYDKGFQVVDLRNVASGNFLLSDVYSRKVAQLSHDVAVTSDGR